MFITYSLQLSFIIEVRDGRPGDRRAPGGSVPPGHGTEGTLCVNAELTNVTTRGKTKKDAEDHLAAPRIDAALLNCSILPLIRLKAEVRPRKLVICLCGTLTT